MPQESHTAPDAALGVGCPFCQVPTERLYYCSEHAVAFLARDAIAPGQSLVVPARHVESLSALDSRELCELFRVAALVGAGLQATGYDAFNMIVNSGAAAGQRIDHVHVHILPRSVDDISEPERWLSGDLFGRLYEPSSEERNDMRTRLSEVVRRLGADPDSARSAADNTRRGFLEGATIHEPVAIGDNCSLWNDVIIGHPTPDLIRAPDRARPVTSIGDGSIIRSGTVIYAGTTVGAGADIGHGVLIREGSVLGRGVYLLPGSQIHARVRVGDRARIYGFVGNGSVIGDDASCHGMLVHRYETRRRGTREVAPTVEPGAVVGVGAIVLGGVTVGKEAIVGAGAIVTRSVPAGTTVVGSPAREISRR